MKTHTCMFCGTTYEVHPGMNSCPGMEGLCAAEWYEPAEEIRPCNCGSGEHWAECPENSEHCG